MILYIDTVLGDKIILALIKEEVEVFKIIALKQITAKRQQSEKLLPAIDDLLLKNNFSNKGIKKIIVNNHGGSFTSLRIGVITANALAFALKIPVLAGEMTRPTENNNGLREGIRYKKNELVKINYLKGSKSFSNYLLVEPFYSSEPNIGLKKTC